MDLSVIDPRLIDAAVDAEGVVWRNALSAPFSLHGVYYDECGAYRRMPSDIAAAVNPGVRALSSATAGGRLRFRTDSPYVAIRAILPPPALMNHMPLSGSAGFALYQNGAYAGKYTPKMEEAIAAKETRALVFAGKVGRRAEGKGLYDCELYFPLYGGVRELHIGLAEGCELLPPTPYKHKKPIVFYGSSITQGACASRPGNDYISILSRRLDADVINLGFSGSGNAEPTILDYLAGIDAGGYVYDYNYYLDRPDRILPPHYDIYKRLRDAHPDVPILMMDKPAACFSKKAYEIRNAMIKESYERALSEGDRLVGYMDSKVMMGEDPTACFVDGDHPNDLGFYRMAQGLYPVLASLLGAG